jgi:hypothetical protein
MSTLTNEQILGGVDLENSKKLSLSKEDNLPLLTDENIEKIKKSLDSNTILLPISNPESYSFLPNEEGYLGAYMNYLDPNGNIVQFYDPTIIIQFYGTNIFSLFREFPKEDIEEYIGKKIYYYILKKINANQNINGKKIAKPGKLTGMILDGTDIYELLNLIKYETLLNNKIEEAILVWEEYESSNSNKSEEEQYSINLSEEKIRELTILCIKLALFKKSIVLSNGSENPVYSDVFNRILEEVKSKSFIPNKILERIIELLNFIINRVIPNPSLVYIGYSGPRSIENLKSILQHLNLTIPPHPKLNGKILSLKDERFPYRYYGEELKNVIINSLNDDSKLTSIGLLVSLWDQTDGLQVFVDEVSNM